MELCLAISPGELTRAEQKILDYINTNTDAFLFSSIGQLARQLGLSDATVSRFARHVGCTDFKELKSLVVEQAAGPAAKMAGTLSQDGGFSPVAWLERQQLYLQKTAQQLDPVEFDRAADALASARRIFLHGKNASSSLANMLAFRLRRLGLPVSLLPSGGSVLLVGHLGKLIKVSAGCMNTHSKVADARRETLAAHAALAGGDRALVKALFDSPTTDAGVELLRGAGLLEPVMDSIAGELDAQLKRRAGPELAIEGIFFSNQYGILGKTPGAEGLLALHRA